MADHIQNVVVVGTCFGEHYLAALAKASHAYRLRGILARGSQRSQSLAAHFGVPLYHRVEDLPEGKVDLACVVVRTTLFGGEGSKLAAALINRGIHVVQEHPVHPGEVASLRRRAAEQGVRYHVNSFYPHLPAVRHAIDYAAAARRNGPAAFAQMTTSPQLLYSTLDILGRAIGGLEAFRCEKSFSADEMPFHSFQGMAAGIPFNLLLQSYLDPSDPDHHSLVMHSMAIGWPEGVINLVNSFGPAIWTHSLYAPDYRKDGLESSYLLAPEAFAKSRYFIQPSAQVFGSPRGAPFWEVVHEQFPGAILRALDELNQAIAAPDSVPWQTDTYLTDLGQAWVSVLRLAGAVREKSLPAPPPPQPDPVEFAKERRDVDECID
ncbi:Gfo/Idh/MocA family oxidoreductase [Rhizobium sp. FKY42]|uniref:Gfo/Idh/MocA family oxidoreductase n=1 Tax=Rhizobium sp. FKY42 TaxID=2562310 RepID=UPI0010BF99B0|nr:Gfo/Idh/MocA family oxidoreductase [Rhizobium sp. FKY42]